MLVVLVDLGAMVQFHSFDKVSLEMLFIGRNCKIEPQHTIQQEEIRQCKNESANASACESCGVLFDESDPHKRKR